MPESGSERRRERRTWAIGVDVGGTWVRVLALDGRGRRRFLKAPAPGGAGLPALLRGIRRRWRLERDGVRALVVASKGVWTTTERRILARRLQGLAPRVLVMSDAEAAHRGALGAGAGILLLSGTGSMALGRNARGRWVRAGGLGPLLGDEGSAFWIGREWLRRLIRDEGAGRGRRIAAAADPVARIAALAPGVLSRARAGSRAARRTVAMAQAALADLLVTVARGLRLRSPVAVSWAGGLLDDARFRAGVWRAARRRGLRARPTPPRERPVDAAARLALRLR